jgi:ABC-type sugar transport system ATPase subunit
VPVSTLSGGNQQKVIFAKWLARNVGVLLLDEPTHGVDMAAKAQIHRAIREFVAKGGGVIASSTDIDELLNIADSIVAMRDGQPVGRIDRRQGLNEQTLREMIGG